MLEDILSYFGMSHNPFPVALDPKNYYQTESSKAYLEELVHGIESRKGFLVLVGEVGVGKTSLSLQLLKLLEEKKIPTSWVFNTVFTKEELLLAVARDWGLTPADDLSFPRLVETLHHFLLDQNKAGNNCVIVIDEAHNLDPTSLEALRMLSNLEYDGQKLVQILLIGQQELHLLLEEPRMRQLLSRVAIFLEHPTLSKEEARGYVDFKLAKADSQMRLEGAALDRLWEATRGNLRQMNLIMERSLYACIALRENRLSANVLELAIRDVAACNPQVRQRMRQGRKRRLALRVGLFALAAALVAGGLVVARLKSPAQSAPEVPRAESPAPAPAKPAPAPAAPAPAKPGPVPSASAPALPASGPASPAVLPAASPSAPSAPAPAAQTAPAAPAAAPVAAAVQPAPNPTVPAPAPPPAGPAQAESAPSPEALERVTPGYEGPEALYLQRLLKAAGVYRGPSDGVFGKKSWYALSDFQKKNGLKPTGLPDRETMEKLSARASTGQAGEERP